MTARLRRLVELVRYLRARECVVGHRRWACDCIKPCP